MRTRGFSLVGMLVAAAVGTIVMSMGLTALARVQSAWQAASIESRLHERAQYALASLETELQMAGYFAGSAPAPLPHAAVPASAATCGTEIVARLDIAVEASDADYALACAARGGGHREGTDVLVVRRLSTRTATSPGRMLWPECSGAACAAGSPLPRELMVRIYYVAEHADGDPATPALRTKSLTAVAGNPAFIDTEVMSGVDDLQITLEPDVMHPHIVQVTVGVRADAAEQGAAPPRRLSVTRRFAVRNASNAT